MSSSVDDTSGPTADTLIRFTDTIVKHINIVVKDKPAPQFRTLRVGLDRLIEALIFKYPDFKLSRNDSIRIDTVLDALAKEKKVLRGRWRKNQWLGVNMLEKMSRAWLQEALDDGCRSWDVQLHKLFSIVLVSALGCRSGEVARTDRSVEEYMRWSHIELKLAAGRATIDDLEANITLCYEKGKK